MKVVVKDNGGGMSFDGNKSNGKSLGSGITYKRIQLINDGKETQSLPIIKSDENGTEIGLILSI